MVLFYLNKGVFIMKKWLVIIVVIIIVPMAYSLFNGKELLSSNEVTETVLSEIYFDEKHTEVANGDFLYLLEGHDPNSRDKVTMTFFVDDERVWNLIEPNNYYTVSYTKKENERYYSIINIDISQRINN